MPKCFPHVFTIIRKKNSDPEFDHLTLLVHLENKYLVDVGFGDSFRNPLILPDGENEDVSGKYKISSIDQNNFELLKKDENGDSLLQYRFNITPKKFEEFEEMCTFQQKSPHSHFRTRMLCTLATEKGRITLTDKSLTITEGNSKSKIEIECDAQFYSYLRKFFGIELYDEK